MDYQAEMTITSIEQWAAASAYLMNGMNQFSNQEINEAENTLIQLISIERIQGNQIYEEVFERALKVLRRLYK